ncbi:MAG: DUF1080 domain-containing protein [Bacteroidota bacterium]
MRLLLLFLALAACSGTASPPVNSEKARLGTEAETPGDWIVLFDGTSLDGWRGYNREDIPPAWSLEDGALTFTPGGEGGDLVAPGLYEDFELVLEWRVGACGNSGILYHIEETEALRASWQTGLEMQILDDTCHSDARYPSHRAGALYDLYVPTIAAARPAGEWNEARIRVEDGTITHVVNGETLVTAERGSADWQARVAASKFRDEAKFPRFGTRTSGALALQDHGDPVAYRDIRIRRL